MTTLLQRGFSLLGRTLRAAAGESVAYTRGATVLCESLAAMLSNQQIEQLSDSGPVVIGRQFAWSLYRADLVYAGEKITPQKLDRIRWQWKAAEYVFEILPEIAGPAVSEVDPRSVWIPISSKLIEINEQ